MKADLLKFSDQGGCSSKIPPSQLEEILKFLPVSADPSILVNIDTHDDAGVYKINDELALVLTTDFFPPVVSDPYEFGQIAAANSISDIYAMGATPVLALNIMMFPSTKLPMEAYADILKGGFDKASEAGVIIIGGHTIDDMVPKFGLAVTGFVNPSKLVTNAGAKPGDLLILTKPIGTGVIMAADRLGMAEKNDVEKAKMLMKQLNRGGAEVMTARGIKGATDITGFGLAGHALKMARASNVSIEINMERVPLIGNTMALIDDGCIPGACFTNLEYAEKDISADDKLSYCLKMAAFDAQTSGGLLISVPAELVNEVNSAIQKGGFPESTIIGKVTHRKEKLLYIN